MQDKSIHVRFVRKNVKRTFIKIVNQNEVVVTSFRALTEEEIAKMLEEHKDWIEKQINKFQAIMLKENEVLYFGVIYQLVLAPLKKNEYRFDESTLRVGEKGLGSLYADGLLEILNLAKNIGKQMKLEADFGFRKMKTKWGVCHITKKKIVLNKVLVHVPKHLVEYIIYHEYVHFYHPNHSKAYYQALGKVCPKHKEYKKQLSEYGFLL